MGRHPSPKILNPAFEVGHTLQGAVPARFQLAGNMALGRVDQLVSPAGEGSLISGSFEFPLDRRDDVLLRALRLIGSEDRSVDGTIGNGIENLQADGPTDPDAAVAIARPCTDMPVTAGEL